MIRVILQTWTMDKSHFDDRMNMHASVILEGDPQEARQLLGRRDLELRPIEPAVPTPKVFDVKQGDEVKYVFIDGSNDQLQLSEWMKVRSVNGDVIGIGPGLYRVLRCQLVAHTPKVSIDVEGATLTASNNTLKVKDGYKLVKVSTQERVDVDCVIHGLADPSPASDQVTREYLDKQYVNDPLADFRKQVKEFNLE